MSQAVSSSAEDTPCQQLAVQLSFRAAPWATEAAWTSSTLAKADWLTWCTPYVYTSILSQPALR